MSFEYWAPFHLLDWPERLSQVFWVEQEREVCSNHSVSYTTARDIELSAETRGRVA
jgi:hypothetical protein